MRRTIAAIILAALCAFPAQAKPWYKSKRVWIVLPIIAASVAFDVHSSVVTPKYPEVGFPARYIVGRYPSQGKLIAFGAGIFTAEVFSDHAVRKFTRDSESKTWRTVGNLAVPVFASVTHGYAAAHNYRLPH